jgi:hypothetical protein
LDCLGALAVVAKKDGYVKPQVTDEPQVRLFFTFLLFS